MEVDGYGPFGKETLFSVSIAGIGMNEKFFPSPRKFNPDRFLENGEYRADRNLIPFSVGARRCPGESLAMAETAVSIAKLVEHFEITNPDRDASLDKELSETE